MKKNIIRLIVLIIISVTASCESGMKSCVKGMMNEGYSYDDAWDMCKDEELNSAIR